jgi:hypothetical protein
LHKEQKMKRLVFILVLTFSLSVITYHFASAQCSVCARTAQQQGERPAKALNAGIIYLALMPLTICSVIGYRWWKSNK